MSLKSFHIFFIITAIVVSFSASYWAWIENSRGAALVCLAAGAVLTAYLIWFLKKGEGPA